MKLLHTADLHIGKTLHEFSMLEEQKNVLLQIIEIAKEEKVDAIMIAGDVYDRSVPSTDAVLLLDDFLTNILSLDIKIFMISGNHDSAERLRFANKILEKQGCFIVGNVAEKTVKSIVLEDAYGMVQFDFIPFIKPAMFGVKTTQAAIEEVMKTIKVPSQKDVRKVCMTHFFVTNAGILPELSDSESSIYVGGLDNVDASLFDAYDYVALGHIHKPQQIGERPIYYAGAPLKYSFSEATIEKSVNLVTLRKKGELTVVRKKITPIHDMRKIKGTLSQLTQKSIVGSADCADYLQVTLTDNAQLVDPIGTLRSVYKNVCQIILERNHQEIEQKEIDKSYMPQKKGIYEMFSEFYQTVTGKELDKKRRQAVIEMIEETKE